MGRGVNVVKSGTLDIKYDIIQYDHEDTPLFDWRVNSLVDSDRWFYSVEAAEQDVISYFQRGV